MGKNSDFALSNQVSVPNNLPDASVSATSGSSWIPAGHPIGIVLMLLGSAAIVYGIVGSWKKLRYATLSLVGGLICWAIVLSPFTPHLHPFIGGWHLHMGWAILIFGFWVIVKWIKWFEFDDHFAGLSILSLGFFGALAIERLIGNGTCTPFWWLLTFCWFMGFSEAILRSQWGTDSPAAKWTAIVTGWLMIFLLC